ncbi:MAG: CrcB family protein [Bifidobacteriaceae bacterium]|jgi:CrcB protein|nr:CrcB family protein [Bifidobacteriaceae bacterium]
MTWLAIALAIALGGALGSCARYGIGLLFERWWPEGGGQAQSAATLAVNVLGSALAGCLAGYLAGRSVTTVAAELVWTNGWSGIAGIAAVGLLGGFTTFSAASVQAAQLAESADGWPRTKALASACLMAVASIGAGALGFALSR